MMTNMAKQIVAFLAIGLLMASTAALAAIEIEKEGHLTIFEVSVDYDDSSMLIIGIDLDFGPQPLKVILGDTDISADCALDDPYAYPQTIFCNGLDLPVTTDLLLLVSNGEGASHNDEYDLTFGGPSSDAASQVVAGQDSTALSTAVCPAGTFAIGGGFFMVNDSPPFASFPSTTSAGTVPVGFPAPAWSVIKNPSDGVLVTAFAICAP